MSIAIASVGGGAIASGAESNGLDQQEMRFYSSYSSVRQIITIHIAR